MTDPYDAPLSALRDHVEDLAVALAIWTNRKEPDAQARRCANYAVDAVDAAIGHLHTIRRELISEIRTSDDQAAARADELVTRLREDREGGE